MKKLKRISLILVSIGSTILFAACSNNVESNHLETKTKISDEQTSTNGQKAGIEGYVVGMRNHQFLVVSTEAKNYESTGGVKEFYSAIWFSNAPNNIQIGQKVRVWFNYTEDSYPGQSNAEKVKILQNKKYAGANLTEAGVIKKVIHDQSSKMKKLMIPTIIIKEIKYDARLHRFDVQIQDPDGKHKWNYLLEDKQ